MAEPRRAELIPLGPGRILGEQKKKDKVVPAVRFTLELTESTEKRCPEFSYLDLLKNAVDNDEEKLKELDPFAAQDIEEQKKLEAIAKSFDEKYGAGSKLTAKKKKKIGRLQDLVDLGDGYDETDPFVDNSEAYDEIVPACLTTKLGGFYINSGVLDFREVSDSDDDDIIGSVRLKKKKKKMMMKKLNDELLKQKKKKKLSYSGSEGDKPKKKRKLDETLYKKTVVKVDPVEKQPISTPVESVVSSDLPNGVQKNGEESAVFNAKLESTFDDVLMSVGGESADEKSDGENPLQPSYTPENVPKLPEGCPRIIEENVAKLKLAARQSELGKCKFFGPNVNDLLLAVDKEARKLPCSQRSNIYIHLAAHLPCSKETLLKRAKKLRHEEGESNLSSALEKLKEAVTKTMPQELQKYETQCKLANAAYNSEENSTKDYGGTSDSDVSSENDKIKRRAPRKKFTWTNSLRELLCTLVSAKLRMYELLKIRSETSEDYLKSFLISTVIPLWPQGWMTVKSLERESKNVLEKPNSIIPKQKKKPPAATNNVNSAASRPTQNQPPTNHLKLRAPSPDFGTDINSFKNLLDYANDDDDVNLLNESTDADVLIADLFKSTSASDLLQSMSDAALNEENTKTLQQNQKQPEPVNQKPKTGSSHVPMETQKQKLSHVAMEAHKQKLSPLVLTDFDKYAQNVNSSPHNSNPAHNRASNTGANSMQSVSDTVDKYKVKNGGQLQSPSGPRNLVADLIRSQGSSNNYSTVSQGHSISGTGLAQGNNRMQQMIPPSNHPDQRLLSPEANRQSINRSSDANRLKSNDTSPRQNNTNILGNILGQMGPISPDKNVQSQRHSPGSSYKTHQFSPTVTKDSHPHSISMLTKPRTSGSSDPPSPMVTKQAVRTPTSPMLNKPPVRVSPSGPVSPKVTGANDVRTLLRQQSDPLDYNEMYSNMSKQHQLMNSSSNFHHSPHLNLPRNTTTSVWTSPTSHQSSSSFPNMYSPQAQSPSYQEVSMSRALEMSELAKAEAVVRARAMDMAKAESVARAMQSQPVDRGNSLYGSGHSPRGLTSPMSPHHQSPRFPGLLPGSSPVRIRHPFGYMKDPNQSPHGY